jgi:flavin reductase
MPRLTETKASERLRAFPRNPVLPFHLWLRQATQDRVVDAHRRHRGSARRTTFMTFDPKKQRKIMGQFATGVTVVTTGGEAGLHGLTANAVASLSLDPPLVLVAVDKRSATLDYLRKNRCFAVNILRVDQEVLSRRFATVGPKDFSDLNITAAATGAPILADCMAFVDCRVVDVLPGGDHDIFVGEIVAGEYQGGEPLLYFSGAYRRLAK